MHLQGEHANPNATKLRILPYEVKVVSGALLSTPFCLLMNMWLLISELHWISCDVSWFWNFSHCTILWNPSTFQWSGFSEWPLQWSCYLNFSLILFFLVIAHCVVLHKQFQAKHWRPRKSLVYVNVVTGLIWLDWTKFWKNERVSCQKTSSVFSICNFYPLPWPL